MNSIRQRKIWFPFAAIITAGGLATFAMLAQQQPAPGYGPPSAPGTMTFVSGAITQFNYGPNALPESFMLSRSTVVHFPPDLGCQVSGMVKMGDTVKVDGPASTNSYGTQSLELQSLTDSSNGREFTIPHPWSATAYTGSGTIRQLNYGPQGEINGFWLNNDVLVHVRPMAPGRSQVLQLGATASVSGYAHRTITNTTAVGATSLIVNGQTVPMSAAPPPPPVSSAPTPPAPPSPGAAPPPPPGP